MNRAEYAQKREDIKTQYASDPDALKTALKKLSNEWNYSRKKEKQERAEQKEAQKEKWPPLPVSPFDLERFEPIERSILIQYFKNILQSPSEILEALSEKKGVNTQFITSLLTQDRVIELRAKMLDGDEGLQVRAMIRRKYNQGDLRAAEIWLKYFGAQTEETGSRNKPIQDPTIELLLKTLGDMLMDIEEKTASHNVLLVRKDGLPVKEVRL